MKFLYQSTLSLVLIMASHTIEAKSINIEHGYSPSQLQVNTRLSQTKLVQHASNTVFLDITFAPPEISNIQKQQRATDIIIILDKSGSMSEAKKMPYAKAAIWDVLGRLNQNDRFALVSFSDNAIVQSPLVNVSNATRSYLNNIVSSIRASGGTNIGAGLNTALNLLEDRNSERAKKILLLSDGQANQGITNPQQLALIAAKATHYGAVLSTIGMGLGFNETLMAKLADYGMGHYSYLEDLSGLSTILARDLNDTRNIYANSSTLEINLTDGVKLIDAGGYPITQQGNSAKINIATGQMLSNTQKHFVMTFNVPTHNIADFSLGKLQLNYQVKGEQLHYQIKPQQLVLTVVAPEQKIQAQKSIDKEIYQKSWVENNLGRMKKKLSQWMREGKKDKAKNEIAKYRKEMKDAASVSNIPLASIKMDEQLSEMEEQIEEAFVGKAMDQQVKRNRAAKSMQYDSIKKQRN
ncbi:MAG: VWA domain-containing protein [Methylococcales bacterium]|nr:VWA domain-containing protein [Methylococcales bacterium]